MAKRPLSRKVFSALIVLVLFLQACQSDTPAPTAFPPGFTPQATQALSRRRRNAHPHPGQPARAGRHPCLAGPHFPARRLGRPVRTGCRQAGYRRGAAFPDGQHRRTGE